jgi:hypothetical protein
MGKHESIKHQPKSADEVASNGDTAAAMMPKMALAMVEGPKASEIEAPELDASKAAMRAVESARIEAPKIELASIEAPRIAPDIDELEPAATDDASSKTTDAGAAEVPRSQVGRFALLAASLALAAGLGGMVGALGATSLVRPASVPAAATGRTGLEEFQALKENVVQARVELAAMKQSIEAGNRSANAQLTKIGERIDRVERVQAEPVAKLGKAIETLERLTRPDTKDVTGSIAPPPSAAAPVKPAVVDGWVLHNVHRGTALLEGRMGLIEVDQGDVVPGLGRVEAIRKQEGRWVVQTSKGLVMPAR